MTITFDAVTLNTTNNVADFTQSHGGAGSGVKGALAFIPWRTASVDEIVGVTYGGATMTEVALSPLINASGEVGGVSGWFLGSSVPQGTQTLAVDLIGSPAGAYQAVVLTLLAGANLEIEDTSTVGPSTSLANPSMSLTTGASVTTFCAGCLFSGQNAPASITPGADYTALGAGHDFGNQSARGIRRTTNASGGSVTLDWVQAADDAAGIGVAIKEASAAAPAMAPDYFSQYGSFY